MMKALNIYTFPQDENLPHSIRLMAGFLYLNHSYKEEHHVCTKSKRLAH